MTIQLKAAQPDVLGPLTELLAAHHLPVSDLPGGLPNFWIAVNSDRLIGSIGFEKYGNIGLLRSVCVDVDYRNQGIAHQLYNVLSQTAQQQGIDTLYLITTTAAQYFARLGFTAIDRNEAPTSIQQTSQFSSLCPASAIVMRQTL
ncbi:GNAT family N-acetyltransferase [Spirosoma sp. BT702]|uniref:GNAT family N-acetyltransferase n=1 Tax=Spirosoma profusum TaxID=2771354 RepID=A0A926XXY9_9BACT|nr:arsenic resistance N-acetyltransferase ArsN2 [Spirosoma profusum]MBD2702220.1 GNAT family N-acetyltransferase [Spirosoma profusum]